MAQPSTLHRFEVELADVDRGVYETLDLRVALHPSESEDRMVVRVLARCLAHEEGLEFGRGLSTPEDGAIERRDPTGRLERYIDVGAPSADRLHRASKACPSVMVFTHKNRATLRKEWTARKSIHKAERIEVVELPGPLVEALAEAVERQQSWVVSLSDAYLSVSAGDVHVDGQVLRRSLQDFLRADE